MDITHLGHASFKIRGRQASLITDPFSPEMVGLKFPKVEADIVTVSHNHEDHNNVTIIGGNPQVFTGPGEYEAKGVKISGIATFHDAENGAKRGNNTVYEIQMDGLRLVHLGDLGSKLTTEQIETLNGADILMIPVGGVYSLDAKNAATVVAQLEPLIVVPMHYKPRPRLERGLVAASASAAFQVPGLKFQLEPVEKFLKEMGKDEVKPLPKLSVTKDKLPEEMQIIVLD